MVDRVLGRVALPVEELNRLRAEADAREQGARNLYLNSLDAPGAPLAGAFDEGRLLRSSGLAGSALAFEPPPIDIPRTIDIGDILANAEPTAAAPTRPARSAPAAAPSSAATPTNAQQGETAPQQDTQRAVQIVGQLLNTGSQGQPRPSYASDIADAQNRVATILARSLRGMDGAGGLERIGQAAIETLSGGGKVSFPEAMAQIEGKESSRAYNIANALSGLARAQNAGQLSAKDQAMLAQRKAEAAARMGNSEARNLVSAVDKITSGYANKAAAQEAAWEYINDWNSRNPGADPGRFSEVMRGTADYVQSKGLALARGRGGAGAGGSGAGGGGAKADGLYIDEDGQEAFRPYTDSKLTPAMREANRAYRNGDIETAISIAKSIRFKAMGGAGSASKSDEKFIDDFEKSLVSTNTARNLIRRTKDLVVNSPAATGATGLLSQVVDGFGAQINNVFGTAVTVRPESGAPSYAISQADLRNQIGVDRAWNRITGGNSSLTDSFRWLNGRTASDAQAIKTNYLLLAFSVARAIDPGGRISDKDVQGVLSALGQGGAGLLTSSTQMARALEEIDEYMLNALESKHGVGSYRPAFRERYPDFDIIRRGAGRRTAPAAPATPAQPAAPAAGAPPASTPGRVLIWNPDKQDFD